jgi:hypothetical protein
LALAFIAGVSAIVDLLESMMRTAGVTLRDHEPSPLSSICAALVNP